MPNFVDSLRNNHEIILLDLRQLLPWYNTTRNEVLDSELCVCQSRLLTINVARVRFVATVAL